MALIEDLKIAGGIDLNRDGTPIYVQLAGLFRRRIESGEWPVGGQIPTLDALALEFGVARATIRQTTGLLRQEGLVARYRGRGTIVLRRPQREFWYEVGANWDSIIAAYRHDGFASRLLETRHDLPPPPDYAGDIEASDYFHIRRLNTIGAEPVAVDAAWLNARLRARLDERALASFPTLLLLHEMPGVTIDRVLQTITIASADVELSALLRVPLNAPIAVIHRTLYGADDVLLCLYQSFTRGDSFRLKMRIR
ncbi:MAG TPA: GntR family transcriptional regulator [Xanthobacteraceae bacterium]|jgi:GntR family transcriptional regulator